MFSDGCALFRQFVAIEHSEENLDFWQHCEEFKRLKRSGDGEKAAGKARQIFDLHLSTSADKEVFFALIFPSLLIIFILKVNLDSATKSATKELLEAAGLFADDCLAVGKRLDTSVFELAQSKIEQLMAKDSYQRFLKSDTFAQVCKDGGKPTSNDGKHFRLGARQSTSPTPTTASTANQSNNSRLSPTSVGDKCYKLLLIV